MSRIPNTEARERILKTAHDFIYRRGFKGASMDDIAEAAGLKKANLFHYYPTKEALGLAVFDTATLEARRKMGGELSTANPNPVKIIAAMFNEAALRMKKSSCVGGCFIGNIAQELSDHNENLRRKVADYLQSWGDDLTQMFERAEAHGYFKKGFKARESAEAIISLFEGAMLLCKAHKKVTPLVSARNMATSYLLSLR